MGNRNSLAQLVLQREDLGSAPDTLTYITFASDQRIFLQINRGLLELGGMGKRSLFRVKEIGNGWVAFESVHYPGSFVAFGADGTPVVAAGVDTKKLSPNACFHVSSALFAHEAVISIKSLASGHCLKEQAGALHAQPRPSSKRNARDLSSGRGRAPPPGPDPCDIAPHIPLSALFVVLQSDTAAPAGLQSLVVNPYVSPPVASPVDCNSVGLAPSHSHVPLDSFQLAPLSSPRLRVAITHKGPGLVSARGSSATGERWGDGEPECPSSWFRAEPVGEQIWRLVKAADTSRCLAFDSKGNGVALLSSEAAIDGESDDSNNAKFFVFPGSLSHAGLLQSSSNSVNHTGDYLI